MEIFDFDEEDNDRDEDYLKNLFLGYYSPPLHESLPEDSRNNLITFATTCFENTSPLIQGYYFKTDLNMRLFFRAMTVLIFSNSQGCYIENAYRFVEKTFSDEPDLSPYCSTDFLFIIFGESEPKHSYNFEVSNYIAKRRARKMKRTFILSLKSDNEIEKQYKKKNEDIIEKFCVPLIPLNGTTIKSISEITSQWKWDFW